MKRCTIYAFIAFAPVYSPVEQWTVAVKSSQKKIDCLPISAGIVTTASQRLDLYGSGPDDPKRKFALVAFGRKQIKVHQLAAPAFACVDQAIRHCPEFQTYSFDWISDATLWRPIRGSSERSTHAWGLAIDINPQRNPLCTVTATSECRLEDANVADMPKCFVQAFQTYGFRWGGDFFPRRDPMHFQFEGDPAIASKAPVILRGARNLYPRSVIPSVAKNLRSTYYDVTGNTDWFTLQPSLATASLDVIISLGCSTGVECANLVDFWHRYLSNATSELIQNRLFKQCAREGADCYDAWTKDDFCLFAAKEDQKLLNCPVRRN